MEKKSQIINLWKPISLQDYEDNWAKCDTSKLERVLPSWIEQRKRISLESKEYANFIEKIKRQHAVETGLIERLYSLKEGITETLIDEGFYESLIQHGDSDISTRELLNYLNDQKSAVDFVFDIIKENQNVSLSRILELHHLITNNQEYTEGKDQFGNFIKIKLIKGMFKELDNNPSRDDGTVFKYCPPVHVRGEIEKLIEIYNIIESRGDKSVIVASWFHHAFTIIHPFQDGNGRMARLLTSLILIKRGLFPFSTRDKKNYILALSEADSNNTQKFVDFVCDSQAKYIGLALNTDFEQSLNQESYEKAADAFINAISNKAQEYKKERKILFDKKRNEIFSFVKSNVENYKKSLSNRMPKEVTIMLESADFLDERKSHYYTHQIASYAKSYNYYANPNYPRAFVKFSVNLFRRNRYILIFSLHQFGYSDNTLAIGGFLIQTEFKYTNRGEPTSYDLVSTDPIIEPLILSLDSAELLEIDVKIFVERACTVTLATIASALKP